MNLLTARIDYGLRALLELAGRPPGKPTQSREIALAQQIPESYLNQLLVSLRRAGLVRSVRGAAGGYTLGREAHQVTIAEVLEALHGHDYLEVEPGGPAVPGVEQAVRRFYGSVHTEIRQRMSQTTLADLVADAQRLNENQSLMLGL